MLLDTAMLYGGSHVPSLQNCRHCARELLHEVATGVHKDATPAGCTVLMSILPELNDGPWRDDAHRTAALRPYLRRLLALDPAGDARRIWAAMDHMCRRLLPDIFDALGLGAAARDLRDLEPITDTQSFDRAIRAANTGAIQVRAFDTIDSVRSAGAFAVIRALRARNLVGALAALNPRTCGALLSLNSSAVAVWERMTRELLDIICGIE